MIGIDLNGRTALVTGATGELGRVMARTLAAAGADVAVHYNTNGAKARSWSRRSKEWAEEPLRSKPTSRNWIPSWRCATR